MAKPKIRFKGYTDDWEQRKLGDMMDVTSVKRIRQSDWTDSGVRFLRARDIVAESKNEEVSEPLFISQEKYDEYSAVSGKVEKGDLLVTGVGTIGVPMLINSEEPLYFKDGNIIWFKNKNAIDGRFFYHLFNGLNVQKFIKESAGTGTVGTYTIENGKKTPINLPLRKEEQEKIGEYFSNLDHLITLHQRKCEETKKLKKYMLQKMFPQNGQTVPEIRFAGFTDAWEQRKLEVFGKATGGTSIESEFSEDGIYKVISIGSYSENSVYNDQGIRAIKSDKTSNRVLNQNDLTMILNDKTTSGNIIGRVLLIEESGIYVYNQRTERIEINLDEYDPVFLYEMLNAPNIREKIIKQAQGNTQIYVNWTAISLLEYMIPSKEEQVKIGEYLHSISNLITLHQCKCYLLFKLLHNDWEQRKLGDVLVSLQNNTLSRADLSNETGVAKNVHYGDVLIKFGEVLDVSKELLPMISDKSILIKYKTSFLQNGDVIIADTAEDTTVGKCSEIVGLNDEVVLSGLHTIPYRPVEKFAPKYLGYYLNSDAYHNQLIPLMQGIKVTSISKSAMQDTDIIYPKSKEEQTEIGNYFDALDHLITLHHRKYTDTLKAP